jgi:hypothetical protein
MHHQKGADMTTKKNPAPAPNKASAGQKKLGAKTAQGPDPAKAEAMAKMALRPSVNAAVVIDCYSKAFGEQDLGALIDALGEGVSDVQGGDLKRAEAMLYTQAHALQSIFMNMARRAQSQEYLKNLDTFLRIGLKAQNQCRMTLETLATIKNPPVVFARQANINNGGQQQVNNGPAPDGPKVRKTEVRNQVRTPTRTANSSTDQTELLEASHGQRLDTRATGQTGGADPQLETMGTVHRAPNTPGQGQGIPQR